MDKNKITVSVSDAKVSNNTEDVLKTYSLGSCVGVCLYDSSARIGGMLHYQLPDSKIDMNKACEKPLMFADTGMKILISKMVSMGAIKSRLRASLAGGATMKEGPKGFDIGKRNYLAIRKIMWKNSIFVNGEDIGGSSPRNMSLHISDGTVAVRSNGVVKEI